MLHKSQLLDFNSDIAIVICTYNPDEQIFARTLNAVQLLEIPENIKVECIIVDNNSSIPVEQLNYVKSFLEGCNWARVISEYKQGLTFARITGVQSTTAPIIIFIDDDNETDKNYLHAVKKCLDDYPCIAAFGPGNINVEFLAPVSDWFDKKFRYSFQQRNSQYVEYGCVFAKWADFYPFGTGLVVKREVFDKYYEGIKKGILTATDRKGGSLSSGGDIQIVWEAVKMGWAAGVSPELKITHLISGKRANLNYIKRLTFGTAYSYMPSLVSSFPSEKDKALAAIPSQKTILKNIVKIVVSHFIKFKYKILPIELADYLGRVGGILRATESNEYYWINKFIQILKLN